MVHCSGQWRAYLEIWNPQLSAVGVFQKRGPGPWEYISGVHFQKCSKFCIIFFTLNFTTIFSPTMGQAQRPPKYAPGLGSYSVNKESLMSHSTHNGPFRAGVSLNNPSQAGYRTAILITVVQHSESRYHTFYTHTLWQNVHGAKTKMKFMKQTESDKVPTTSATTKWHHGPSLHMLHENNDDNDVDNNNTNISFRNKLKHKM